MKTKKIILLNLLVISMLLTLVIGCSQKADDNQDEKESENGDKAQVSELKESSKDKKDNEEKEDSSDKEGEKEVSNKEDSNKADNAEKTSKDKENNISSNSSSKESNETASKNESSSSNKVNSSTSTNKNTGSSNTTSSKPTAKPQPKPEPTIRTKNETKTESISYTTEKKYDSNLEKGKQIVDRNGKNGVRTIVYKITLTDGRETSRKVISNEVTTSPVSKVIRIGTKEEPKMGPTERAVLNALPSGYTTKSVSRRGIEVFKNGSKVGFVNHGGFTVYVINSSNKNALIDAGNALGISKTTVTKAIHQYETGNGLSIQIDNIHVVNNGHGLRVSKLR